MEVKQENTFKAFKVVAAVPLSHFHMPHLSYLAVISNSACGCITCEYAFTKAKRVV